MANPETTPVYPKCIFHATTGLECPGCGSSRAAYDFVHFDFKAAFVHNPLAFLAIPGLLIYAFGGLLGLWKRFSFNWVPKSIRSRLSLITLIVVAAFTLLRNLW